MAGANCGDGFLVFLLFNKTLGFFFFFFLCFTDFVARVPSERDQPSPRGPVSPGVEGQGGRVPAGKEPCCGRWEQAAQGLGQLLLPAPSARTSLLQVVVSPNSSSSWEYLYVQKKGSGLISPEP